MYVVQFSPADEYLRVLVLVVCSVCLFFNLLYSQTKSIYLCLDKRFPFYSALEFLKVPL